MSGTLAGVGPGRMRAPREVRGLVPALAQTANPDVWVWEYDGPDGWRLSIATHGAPGSGALSLGGFRIAPLDRASAPGYDNAREAVGLAMGMEEKIRWSRLIGCAGPRARPHLAKLVGGKCVLLPSAGTRVGEPRDAELLAWAAAALNQFEHDAGVHPVTGQDLGHGTMSDGVTASLAFLHARFRGSVLADTSKPTGEGNWRLLRGLMAGLGGSVHGARVALVGVGNIGEHVRQRLVADGCELIAIESNAAKRTELEAAGIRCWAPDALLKFLAEPVQAVVVNARGGTLSRAACEVIAANPQLAIVCGSENLVMPDPTAADLLAAAQVIYAPTEFGGMMGYLTAVEEYLCARDGAPFDVHRLYDAALGLEEAGHRTAARICAGGFAETFERAVVATYGG